MTENESPPPVDLDQLWPEPWAGHAAMQAVVIKGELERALARPKLTPAENAVKANVEDLLQLAQRATPSKTPVAGPHRPVAWHFGGTRPPLLARRKDCAGRRLGCA